MLLTLCALVAPLRAADPADRSLFLPIDQLQVLLDGTNQRVLLTKNEFNELLKKAKPAELVETPLKSVVLDADSTVTFETGRARITTELQFELLADGLQSIELPVSEAGVTRAVLDGAPAAIGRGANQAFTLFASGRGRHRLQLELLAPVETSTSQQTLRLGLPRPASARLQLVVPGNVEIKSGAQIITRSVDTIAGVTRFSVNPTVEPMTIVLSLNNRQLREQRLIVARGGIVSRLGATEEQLFASYSLNVLHRAAEQFRFAVPPGFDIAEVTSPQLARWTITGSGNDRVLELTLRTPQLGQSLVNIQAVRAGAPQSWQFPQLKPLDVASHTAVVGVWLDRLLKLNQLTSGNLLSIDTSVVEQLAGNSSTDAGRFVAAYYAPTENVALGGVVERRAVERQYDTNLSLVADEAAWHLTATLKLRTAIEPWQELDLRLPAEWTVEEIRGAQNRSLAWQRRTSAEGPMLHIALATPVTESQPQEIHISARHTPADWLTAWTTRSFTLPTLAIPQATAKHGTLAIVIADDLTVEVDEPGTLGPLPDNLLAQVAWSTLDRYQRPLYYAYAGELPAAKFALKKLLPQFSARSYSFYRIESGAIRVHTELVYQVERAHTRELSFSLPKSTPATVTIAGLDGLALKEYGSTDDETDRVWRVSLVERRQGQLRLAVDYDLPLSAEPAELSLPVVRVPGVVHQSGVLAVEGGADWNVIVAQHPTQVDVGELAGADARPGRHLIGAFAYAGETPALAVKLDRPPEHALPPALVARAAYTTLISAHGLSQTAAELTIRAKVSFLEVALPPGIDGSGSTLWSAALDGQTLKPQRNQGRLLVNLSGSGDARARVLRLVYETPIAAIGNLGRFTLPGVSLQVPGSAGAFVVPVADVQWQLVLPQGYRITQSRGTVSQQQDTVLIDQLAAINTMKMLSTSPSRVRYALDLSARSSAGVHLDDDVAYRATITATTPSEVQVEVGDTSVFKSNGKALSTELPEGQMGEARPIAAAYFEALSLKELKEFAAKPDYRVAATLELQRRQAIAIAGSYARAVSNASAEQRRQYEQQLRQNVAQSGNPKAMQLLEELINSVPPQSNGMFANNTRGANPAESEVITQVLEDEIIPSKELALVSTAISSVVGAQGAVSALSEPQLANKSIDAVGEAAKSAEAPKAMESLYTTTAPGTQLPDLRNELRDSEGAVKRTITLGLAESNSNAKNQSHASESKPSEFDSVHKAAIPFDDRVQIAMADQARAGEQRLKRARLDLTGFRSLPIRLEATGAIVQFHSLGIAPELDVSLVQRARHDALAAGIAAVVGVIGAGLILARSKRRWLFIALVMLVATLVPLVTGWHESVALTNPAFYAALALVLFECLVICGRWCLAIGSALCTKCCRRRVAVPPPSPTATLLLMAASLWLGSASTAPAQEPLNPKSPLLVELPESGPPVRLPADVTVWLYEQATGLGVPTAEKVLVPYERYVQLWNRAYPTQPLDLPPPTDYAPAGATYTATLDDSTAGNTDQLIVRGVLEYDVYVDRRVEVPLPLVGGVVAVATVNGQPARLKVVAANPPAQPAANVEMPQKQQAAALPPPAMIALLLEGKQRHKVELTLRYTVARAAGWRVVEGRLPTHPATALSLTVPAAGTEVRLAGVADQASQETKAANETLATAVRLDQPLRIEWRPKADAARRDETLQVNSVGAVLVQEDGVRAVWSVDLQFRGAPRSEFRLTVPKEYQIEQVQGANIRSWETREVDGRREVSLVLLAPAANSESLKITLARAEPMTSTPQELDVPLVIVPDAALNQGSLTLLRSEVLELKTTVATGVSRIDLRAETPTYVEPFAAADRSPLGVTAQESYRFSALPFQLRIAANTRSPQLSAEWRNELRWTPQRAELDAHLQLSIANRSLYQATITMPAEVTIQAVHAATPLEWSTAVENNVRQLRLFFAHGQTGAAAVSISATLPTPAANVTRPLPRLTVSGIERQTTYYEVQAPVSFAIEPSDLQQLQTTPLRDTTNINPRSGTPPTRIALRSEALDYAATITFKRRPATITCTTVTNLRVTPRSIEETTLFDYTIRDSSVSQLSLLLPERLQDARLEVPVAAARQIEPLAERPGWVRVTIRMHDEVSGSLRLLLNHAGPLGAEELNVQPPIVEQSRSGGQFVVVENTGGAELRSDKLVNLEPLVRQQQDWNFLAGLFQTPPTEAYRVKLGATDASLTLTVVERSRVKTADAQILLANTTLVLDARGAYRAVQTYRVDNKTEPYLIVELPRGALLWSTLVDGEPVKPVQPPAGSTNAANVSGTVVAIPLIRTSEGDLDYPVVLKYGGSIVQPGSWSPVELPFMRAVNLGVDLSQVEVFLPEEQRWFGFDGSMRRMDDVQEYEATSLSYNTKRAERLNEALSAGDEFTRIRALGNAVKLQTEITAQQQAQVNVANDYVQQQLDNNRRAAGELQKNFEQAQRKLNEATSQSTSNPYRLNEQYRNQTLFGSNQSAANQPQSKTQPLEELAKEQAKLKSMVSDGKFNAWFERNKLGDLSEKEGRDKQQDGTRKDAARELGRDKDADRRSAMSGEKGEAKKALADQAPVPATSMPALAGKPQSAAAADAKAAPMAGPATPPAPKSESAASNTRGEAEKLGVSATPPAANQPAQPNDVLNRYQLQQQAMPRSDANRNRNQVPSITLREVEPDAVPQARGLASLDVDIPQRGQVFRFTTTRGDLRLSARAVSRHWLDSVTRLLVVLGGIVVLWLLVRVMRSPRVAWCCDSPWCGAIVAFVGLGLTCAAVFPIVGLLMLLGGLAILARATARGCLAS